MNGIRIGIRRIMTVWAVIAVLLGARLALAMHSYDHDPSVPSPECELCDCGHVSNDATVATRLEASKAIRFDLLGFSSPSPLPAAFRRAALPRGPPPPPEHSSS